MKSRKQLKFDYRHLLCIGITVCFLVCTFVIFPAAFVRFGESLSDLWNSIKCYFGTLGNGNNEVPTVNDSSAVHYEPVINVAETFPEFKQSWVAYWQRFVVKDNFLAYCRAVVENLYRFGQIVLLIIVPLLLLANLLFNCIFNKQNNNYNHDSKSLKVMKRFTAKTYIPVKNWCLQFWSFVSSNKFYKYIWLVIWLFNFNLIVIFLEFIAFYLYFAISFDFASIYPQVVKLVKDLSPMFRFVPVWVWIICLFWLIDRFRKNIGYAMLNHMERRNRGFINERPIVYMVCGTMGKKKTTAITDMALSQEIMFRDKAFELILQNDLKFSHFPWINLENVIKQGMAEHRLYNLATVRGYVQQLAFWFYYERRHKKHSRSIRRYLKRCGLWLCDNLCFDYDYERYGLFYDDKLKVVDLWEVLETYAQLYFIYIIQSSLLLANYSLRTDNLLESVGNFPMWNSDLFRRDSRLLDAFSRHAHIIDFDALRLGRKVIEDNPTKDSFDFGVLAITEIGKNVKTICNYRKRKRRTEQRTKRMTVLMIG